MRSPQNSSNPVSQGPVYNKTKPGIDSIFDQLNLLFNMEIIKLRFHFQAKQPIYLPDYKGATFRGAMGKTFKNIVCMVSVKSCESCLMKDSCPYFNLFETPNDGTLQNYQSEKAPKPFVIEPTLTKQKLFRPGEGFSMDLILFGRAIKYAPYFVLFFDEIGRKQGVGKWLHDKWGRYQLIKVTDLSDKEEKIYYLENTIYEENLSNYSVLDLAGHRFDKSSLLLLNFLTYTRMVHKGNILERHNKNHLNFSILLSSIYRRATLLHYFHQHKHISTFSDIVVNPVAKHNSTLTFEDWEHYSNRQRSKLKSGGFIGSIVFSGNWHPWYPLLKLGELLHIGNMTTFGLGKYTLNVIDSA